MPVSVSRSRKKSAEPLLFSESQALRNATPKPPPPPPAPHKPGEPPEPRPRPAVPPPVVEERETPLIPPDEETRSGGPPPRKPAQRATAEAMAGRQREISVSEFFAKNRHLLGFDNKRKALLTTIKEAVDNSLDACEEAGILPDIDVLIDQAGEDRFRVTVRDNGPGIMKAQIPNVFGKLLYGSKFHRLKMSRGQQGIGISAAGMYGLLTTGKPLKINSRTGPQREAHHFELQIDTTKNRPDVFKDEPIDVPWPHGTEVTIELAATYAKGRQSVDEYLEQTAIANPHAQIRYRLALAGSEDGPTEQLFPRGSDDLPRETREIQPHPHGIELGVLMKLLKDAEARGRARGSAGGAEPVRSLAAFLQTSFSRVSPGVSQAICEAARLSPRARPWELSGPQIESLYQAMQGVRIMAPPSDCVAPIGVRALLAGLLKEVKAEFYTATTRDPAVYRGNPFLIEVALAFGGSLPADEPARVIRFANRVPLLYQQSACASFKSVLDVDWRNYGLSQPGNGAPLGPLVVMIHMASVWVPFTSESKEAIADYDEIRKEMKLALQECGRKLGGYVRRRRRQRLEGERRSIFERYIQDVAEALAALTDADSRRLAQELQEIARQRTAEADVELDEDGKPIAKAEKEEDFAGDDSTVIVAENQALDPAAPATAPADGLFVEPGSAKPPRRRRR